MYKATVKEGGDIVIDGFRVVAKVITRGRVRLGIEPIRGKGMAIDDSDPSRLRLTSGQSTSYASQTT